MTESAELFSPLEIRGITLPNRIAVSPMCEYSSSDGFANDWHLVHLGSRAVGGAGLVFTEAAAVTPQGRITPWDLGIWKDAHLEKLRPIVDFGHRQGAHMGIQLAHAGRKASMMRPWDQDRIAEAAEGGWAEVAAPSAIRFAPHFPAPIALDAGGIHRIVESFASAARRAHAAGFDAIEIHSAHGYLLHQFLSPLSNRRDDEYGGSFTNRIRMLTQVVDAVRNEWRGPLFVRISATDWVEGGWDVPQSVELAKILRERAVDLIDVSSGGMDPKAVIPAGPGYQTAFAERIRREAEIRTGAVGFITDPAQADHVVRTGQADLVLIAREMLRDPYWPMHAAARLGKKVSSPVQYLRAAPAGSYPREPLIRR